MVLENLGYENKMVDCERGLGLIGLFGACVDYPGSTLRSELAENLFCGLTPA